MGGFWSKEGNTADLTNETRKVIEEPRPPPRQPPLPKPWRVLEKHYKWNPEYRDYLVGQVKEVNVGEIEHLKILLIGPMSAGKSSFINSVATIDKDRIAQAVPAGTSGTSLSKNLRQFKPKEHIVNRYLLQDTMGIEEVESGGFCVENVISLIEGKIKPNYKFDPQRPIPESDENYVDNPSRKDQSQCIVLVIDAVMIDAKTLSRPLLDKLRQFKQYVRDHEYCVSLVIVLTKIDKLLDGNDISKVYDNARVKTIVGKAEELFGVQEMNIFPVKNYCDETDLNPNMDILLLLALRRMIHVAFDHVENVEDQME